MKYSKNLTLLAIVLSFLPWHLPLLNFTKTAEAAAINLISDGNFDQDINKSWFLWQNSDSKSSYVLARGYEAPFGYGPYSLTIKGSGVTPSIYDATISSIGSSKFSVAANKEYNFSFYIKSTSATKIVIHLQDATTYQPLTVKKEIEVGTTWTKQQITLSPTLGGQASMSIAVGAIPDGATLYFDNLNLFENDANLNTKQISGYIGDKNKTLAMTNGNLFSLSELSIELPYVNEQTGAIGVKKFSPSKKNNSNISFDIPDQTFSGIGKLYAGEKLVGQFNYQVLLKINEVSPNPVLVDEDLVIYGTGFSPYREQSFVSLKTIDAYGKMVEKWIKPHLIDNSLTQMVVKIPVGVINGQLSVRSYYNTLENISVEVKSNAVDYSIKPVIYNLEWSKPGYEQIGDKITITGKGISSHPSVKFYDDNDKLVTSANAKVISVNASSSYETIEATTPRQLNKLKVTVKIGNYESDKADALNYTARPILQVIQSGKSRRTSDYNTQISAAKPGSTIKLSGQGFKGKGGAQVEFTGLNDSIIKVNVPVEKIDANGNSLEVIVPKGAQNGQVRVQLNEQKSNSLPLEMIPEIISTTPIIPAPGEEMTFWTNGVGLDKEMITVYFQLNSKDSIAVKPISLSQSGYDDVIVKVIAPKAISSDNPTIKLQSGYWTNNESYSLATNPYVERASMDSDTKIITISGHGFSSNLLNNKINYKYADGTVVTPKTKMLSITNSSEGQEIKIQILDDYYYGYVSVTVDGQTSNEINLGPAIITKIERRVQFVTAENKVMGVFYITGRNFGNEGSVQIGATLAKTHYRSNTFIIAVVEKEVINNNPVQVTKLK